MSNECDSNNNAVNCGNNNLEKHYSDNRIEKNNHINVN